jgi:hypothetical protein
MVYDCYILLLLFSGRKPKLAEYHQQLNQPKRKRESKFSLVFSPTVLVFFSLLNESSKETV